MTISAAATIGHGYHSGTGQLYGDSAAKTAWRKKPDRRSYWTVRGVSLSRRRRRRCYVRSPRQWLVVVRWRWPTTTHDGDTTTATTVGPRRLSHGHEGLVGGRTTVGRAGRGPGPRRSTASSRGPTALRQFIRLLRSGCTHVARVIVMAANAAYLVVRARTIFGLAQHRRDVTACGGGGGITRICRTTFDVSNTPTHCTLRPSPACHHARPSRVSVLDVNRIVCSVPSRPRRKRHRGRLLRGGGGGDRHGSRRKHLERRAIRTLATHEQRRCVRRGGACSSSAPLPSPIDSRVFSVPATCGSRTDGGRRRTGESRPAIKRSCVYVSPARAEY